MPTLKLSFLTLALPAAMALLTACGARLPSDLSRDRDHEHEDDFYMASIEDLDPAKDPTRSKLSYFFLVEQFNVGANGSMLKAIKNNPPGGILFWNGNAADATAVRDSVKAYSQQAQVMNLKPLLFSTDYEGGALRTTPTGSTVPGVQRFTKGFSALAHPRWLGVSMKDYGTELCGLHGKIMAQELKAVGINYPLSVVSDLATQALTSVRGISKNPEDASRCVTKIFEEFMNTKDLIFVTKHFPGLGLTKGDTHDGTVTASTMDSQTLQAHLKPFIDLVSFSKKKINEGLLSVMTTHAKFMAYDDLNLTTESPKTINGLLKKRIEFTGLVVSDAMWMGEYGNMKGSQLMPVYLNSFLSGVDLLMIPGARFAEAINYFRKVYDDKLSEDEKALLTARTGKSWADTHQKFMERITESLKTHDRARSAIKAPHTYLGSEAPVNLTAQDRSRYNQILSDLSIRGSSLKKN